MNEDNFFDFSHSFSHFSLHGKGFRPLLAAKNDIRHLIYKRLKKENDKSERQYK